jgi:hypothetical protein
MAFLLIAVGWVFLVALTVSLCAAARRGDRSETGFAGTRQAAPADDRQPEDRADESLRRQLRGRHEFRTARTPSGNRAVVSS